MRFHTILKQGRLSNNEWHPVDKQLSSYFSDLEKAKKWITRVMDLIDKEKYPNANVELYEIKEILVEKITHASIRNFDETRKV